MSTLRAHLTNDSFTLRAIYIIVVVWGVLTLLATLDQIAVDLFANPIPASLAVAPFWPKVNPTQKLDGISAFVTGGGYDHATFMIAGLGLDARLWYASSSLIQGAAVLTVTVTIALLCRRIRRGDPFNPVVPQALSLSGIAVLEGGVGAQFLTQIAGYRVIEETFHAHAYSFRTNVAGTTEGAVDWPSASQQFSIEFWPVILALGLFAIAVVFRHGAKLARERAALADEVKGLV
jgi:hypothetical protein